MYPSTDATNELPIYDTATYPNGRHLLSYGPSTPIYPYHQPPINWPVASSYCIGNAYPTYPPYYAYPSIPVRSPTVPHHTLPIHGQAFESNEAHKVINESWLCPKQEEITGSLVETIAKKRSRVLKAAGIEVVRGNRKQRSETVVVYWMMRELRTIDNFSLYYSQLIAKKLGVPLIVYFSPMHSPYPNRRQYEWRIRGLVDVQEALSDLSIPFITEVNDDWSVLKHLLYECDVANIITDFNPIHKVTDLQNCVKEFLPPNTEYSMVDAHNVVPTWLVSNEHEQRAYQMKKKLGKGLQEFKIDLLPPPLSDFETSPFRYLTALDEKYNCVLKSRQEVLALLELDCQATRTEPEVIPITWLDAGQKAGLKLFNSWLEKNLTGYSKYRNDATHPYCTSNASPYLNHGFVSAQSLVLMVQNSEIDEDDKEVFLNQVLVWRELSDNFVYYNQNYANVQGFPKWSLLSYQDHKDDDRTGLYEFDTLENSGTYNELWNAIQYELIIFGKIHPYLRLYWAKCIVEWTANPEIALDYTLRLNDKWSIDGTDPNGYNGCSWSIGGTHDRAFPERHTFGKVRSLTMRGVERKMDIPRWISQMSQTHEAWKTKRPFKGTTHSFDYYRRNGTMFPINEINKSFEEKHLN